MEDMKYGNKSGKSYVKHMKDTEARMEKSFYGEVGKKAKGKDNFFGFTNGAYH